MFGTRSLPGIFCKLLGLFLSGVALLSGIAPYQQMQHLDDDLTVGSSREGDPVDRYYDLFLEDAERAGFRVYQSDNKDKNQKPDTKVTDFGVSHDTEKWEWGFNEKRLAIILDRLRRVDKGERLTLKELESLVGRINAVNLLVEDGRFYVDCICRSIKGVRGAKSLVTEVGCLPAQAT